MSDATTPSFENALENLEEIVSKLESEELPLEKALDLFEKGIKLSKTCTSKLNEAEKKVDVLLDQLSKELEKAPKA